MFHCRYQERTGSLYTSTERVISKSSLESGIEKRGDANPRNAPKVNMLVLRQCRAHFREHFVRPIPTCVKLRQQYYVNKRLRGTVYIRWVRGFSLGSIVRKSCIVIRIISASARNYFWIILIYNQFMLYNNTISTYLVMTK